MKRIYINDFILIAVIICALLFSALLIYKPSDTSMITVMYNNSVYGSYSLDANTILLIGDSGVTIEINNGKAYIKESDCPDKVCIHSQSISKASASGAGIVCLPNKVAVIKSESYTNKEVDAVAG